MPKLRAPPQCLTEAQQGPAQNTQAVPVLPRGKRAPTFYASLGMKIAGFSQNAESLVNSTYSIVKYNHNALVIASQGLFGTILARERHIW